MDIKNLEHLESILYNKDKEIDKLKSKIEDLEGQNDYSNWEWCKHRLIPADDFRKDLPIPRLEIIMEQIGVYSWRWLYGTVYKHYGEMYDKENPKLHFIPFGATTTTSDLSNDMDLPFRDGFHIKSDMLLYKLRGFLTKPSNGSFKEIYCDFDESTKSNILSFYSR